MVVGERKSLSEIKETGAFEQDADAALFLKEGIGRAADAPEEGSRVDRILHVVKQRNGPVRLGIPLRYDKAAHLFR